MKQRLRSKEPDPGWLMRTPRRLQWAVFILVGAVSLLGVFGIERAETQRRHAVLEHSAADIGAALRQINAEHEIYLRASAALLSAQPEITAQSFGQMQSELNFTRYRQGALGVGWAPRVAARDLPRAEPALQAQAGTGFRIHPVPGHDRSDVFPVVFLAPTNPENAVALGFDTYSEPTRRAAMDLAVASNAPVGTGRVQLVQDHRDRAGVAPAGFLIYMPVFGPAPPESRGRPVRGPLRGFVFMPFRAAALLAMASRLSADENIRVAAYDEEVAPGRLMAASAAPVSRSDPGAEAGERGELIETVDMAGRPWRLLVSVDRSGGLSRLSQLIILSGLIVAILLAALIRMTYQKINEERELLAWQASETGIRTSLTRELNHRVKNTLATILSIVTLSRRRESDLDSYVESLSGRIRALSATHDLLTSSEWSSIELRHIILAELAPYLGANDEHVSLDGPDIRLAPSDALTLGLAVHELATNAAKFGALSALAGRIRITWEQLNDTTVEIRWQESAGPIVTEPVKRGFGRELIEKILARELDSPVKLIFAPDGLQCMFRVPLRKPSPFVLRKGPDSPDRMAG